MSFSSSFHDNAAAVRPKNQSAKASTFWVAVLKIDREPSGENTEEDFLWIKCHGRITAHVVRTQYEQTCVPGEPWVLIHESKAANLQATMADLNTFDDQVVVFEAVKTSDTGRLPAREPLRPTNMQILSPPRGEEPSTNMTGVANAKLLITVPRASAINAQGENHSANLFSRPMLPHTSGPPGVSGSGMPPRGDTLSPAAPSQGHGMLGPSPQPPSAIPKQGHQPYQAVPSPRHVDSSRYMGYQGQQARSAKEQAAIIELQEAWLQKHEPPRPSNSAENRSNTAFPHNPTPNATSTPTSDAADMSGCRQYSQAWHERYSRAYPRCTKDQIDGILKQLWSKMSPEEKASYVTGPSMDTHGRSIKAEPKSDTATNTAPATTAVEEPSLTSAELEEQKQKTFQLQTLLLNATPKMLEDSVQQGVKLLDKLKTPLAAKMANSPDAEQWIQQIENLRKQAVKTRTIIGVVGNTGAGKSSVINALLDEERLVPTNCMRACTAVVTEISFNTEEAPYRAQIEFISSAEWEKELKVLFQDLLDAEGKVSRECANEDTDAGIAYAKIKAVYPRKTKEDIANSDVETMLREVSSVLGSTRDVKERDSLLFYQKLRYFVDSKEKATGLKGKGMDKRPEKKEMEFWPLIRVVRIHVKSPVLATGAVIVDLPGVHDANAARAAVAEGYMKQCTGLWIVAPINRAVDDKAAKSLLGESFKRQLKMDGGFNSVTFICSKTDDISLEEAQTSLGLDEDMEPSWAEMDELRKKENSMKKDLDEFQDTKAMYSEIMNDTDEQIELWDALKDKFEDGKSVYPPKAAPLKKRKATSKEKPRKKQRRTLTSDDEDIEDSDIVDKSEEDEDEQPNSSDGDSQRKEPLTEEQITTKMQELRATRKDARTHKLEITDKITVLRKAIGEAKKAEQEIESRMSALCIRGRNQYSKGAIQQDFAAGIKELDQELAAEEDEEGFNPDVETRDYDEVARGLPVFCVSSRGYQKLQGRLRKDPHIGGFATIEETGLPSLQAHCEKLTETGRSASCHAFNNKLSQLLNSLTIWASSDGTGANLTTEQKAREARYLQKGLKTLEDELENAVRSTCKELSDEFTENIFEKFETAVSNAADAAVETALQWGAPVNRENRAAGGLHWATYKAICRRNGIYSNAQGPHEWNIELAEPMMKIIATGWEKTFTRRLPMVMTTFNRTTAAALKSFHRNIEGRARKIGASIAGLSMLQHQVSTYETTLKDYSAATKDTINASQKDINREFTPVIEQAMQDAYDVCVAEHGPGSYARMKTAMHSHVAVERETMFQQSADNVRNRLQAMVKDTEGLMDDKAHEVFTSMKRDYRAVLGGGDVAQEGQMLPREQRLVRREIMGVIDGVEKIFRKVAGLEAEEDEEMGSDHDGQKVEDDSEESAHDSENDDGDQRGAKKETQGAKVDREITLSAQLLEEGESPQPASSQHKRTASKNETTANVHSDNESEPKLQTSEANPQIASLARTKVDGGDGDFEGSNATESSDSE